MKNKIIFSVTKNGIHNIQDNINVVKLLNHWNVKYIIVDGCYKTQTETSYIVENSNATIEPLVRLLCREYSQESYLKIMESSEAYLVYLDNGKVDSIGRFRLTTAAKAKKLDAYTYDRNTRKYYIAS